MFINSEFKTNRLRIKKRILQSIELVLLIEMKSLNLTSSDFVPVIY